MHKLSLYAKLACTNIKANYRLYVPYLLASSGMIMMYYIILMLAMDPGMNNGNLSAALGSGSWIVGLFAVSFILYINSFLMKRRTKEFGLYNVLGMDKPQIACVVFIETAFAFLIAVLGGILLGTVFSKLMQLLLLRMIKYGGDITMQLSLKPVLDTVCLFAVIYFLAYLSTLKTIYQTKPVDLMSSSNAGEKAPKANWAMAIIGAAVLIAGYWLAQYVKNPTEALTYFFIAVALVMIGTFFLFTSCSVAVLKLLQKNKKYYYKKNHFINVSGMMYRMKQNAKGLAQICILSCMVLVTISMTISLYVNTENIVKTSFTKDVEISAYVDSQTDQAKVTDELASYTDLARENETIYVKGGTLLSADSVGLLDLPDHVSSVSVQILSIASYNEQTGRNIVLNGDEIAAYCSANGQIGDALKINQNSYHVKEEILSNPDAFAESAIGNDEQLSVYIYCNDPYAMTDTVQNAKGKPTLVLHDDFDTSASDQEQQKFCDRLSDEYFNAEQGGEAQCYSSFRTEAYTLIGSLLFVGVFLGTLFLIATVLIIYYKQVSEGYEDRHRYEILQQVGLSKAEVKKSINSQVLTVFFMPLGVAMLHICFAFHIVYELMRAFGLSDTSLYLKYLLLTAGAFAIIYMLVYFVTSKVYYHIVENKNA
ncbi:MAG: ABC transporter permease [Solobacterium sp.]|jgi:putative ABC transport system permease protein|nr:ABC transporter permease [Solobacterium sp.]MCH4205566.1 ABC transporter permease [Solobacterium sp.]MCH4227099.1 ABC transporter permease [Solobacterium sp.]MCH4282329.1 ABC transporter permease [Solobacterium sp.]